MPFPTKTSPVLLSIKTGTAWELTHLGWLFTMSNNFLIGSLISFFTFHCLSFEIRNWFMLVKSNNCPVSFLYVLLPHSNNVCFTVQWLQTSWKIFLNKNGDGPDTSRENTWNHWLVGCYDGDRRHQGYRFHRIVLT